ncbi:MAG: UpxY family transcription antiterminator [Desulfobacterales bacterium]|jgi:transcription elongation factor/antiterminator RfaH
MVDVERQRLWYVLHTKSRHENVVFDGLAKKRLEAFLPKVKVRSRRRDRKAMVQVPLFPGYLFVCTDLEPREHLEILKTVGVVRMIGARSRPVPVAEETIQSLRIMVATELPLSTGARLRQGDRVMVVSGPLAGVVGTFIRHRGQGRVLVQIEALGQYAAVDVAEEDVERVPEILA